VTYRLRYARVWLLTQLAYLSGRANRWFRGQIPPAPPERTSSDREAIQHLIAVQGQGCTCPICVRLGFTP
jgi:hypothetical protein